MESHTLLNLFNLKRSNLIRLKDLLNTNNLDELKKTLEIQEYLNYKIDSYKKQHSIHYDTPPLNLDIHSTPYSSNSNLVTFNSTESFNNTLNDSHIIKKKLFEEEAKNLFPSQNNIYMSATPDIKYTHSDKPIISEENCDVNNQYHQFFYDKTLDKIDESEIIPIKSHEPISYSLDTPLDNHISFEEPELLFNNYISTLEQNNIKKTPIEEPKVYTSIEQSVSDDLDEYSPYS